jgi:hypothetical protein
MKAALLAICVLLVFVGNLQAQQTTTIKERDVRIQANMSQKEGVTLRLRGNVVVRTDTLEIRADEAEYNSDTGELEARGNVSIRPTPALYLEFLISVEQADLAAMVPKATDVHPEVVCTRHKTEALELRIKDSATWLAQTGTLKLQLKRSVC